MLYNFEVHVGTLYSKSVFRTGTILYSLFDNLFFEWRMTSSSGSIYFSEYENKLRRLGHILKREETEAVRLINIMHVDEKRERGRLKKR